MKNLLITISENLKLAYINSLIWRHKNLAPQTWADRFLRNAIFQKRGKLPSKTAIVPKKPDEFTRIYWEDKGARIYDKLDLSEFVEKLGIAMTRNLTTTT